MESQGSSAALKDPVPDGTGPIPKPKSPPTTGCCTSAWSPITGLLQAFNSSTSSPLGTPHLPESQSPEGCRWPTCRSWSRSTPRSSSDLVAQEDPCSPVPRGRGDTLTRQEMGLAGNPTNRTESLGSYRKQGSPNPHSRPHSPISVFRHWPEAVSQMRLQRTEPETESLLVQPSFFSRGPHT